MDKEVSLGFSFLHTCTGILRNPMRAFTSPSSHLTILSECSGHKVEHVCFTTLVQSSQHHLRYHRLNLATPHCTFLALQFCFLFPSVWSHGPALISWLPSQPCLFSPTMPPPPPLPTLAQYLPGWNNFLLFIKSFHFIIIRSAPKIQELRATQNSINC